MTQTISLCLGLTLAMLIATTAAFASERSNGVRFNGITVNGITVNGITLNGQAPQQPFGSDLKNLAGKALTQAAEFDAPATPRPSLLTGAETGL